MVGNVFIGIDPGLSGAVAVINDYGYAVYDTPSLEIVVSRVRSRATGKIKEKKRHRYNTAEMVKILRNISESTCSVWLEDIHAMPGQGVVSMFSMGRGLGQWEGIIAALGLPVNMISPVTWKKKMLFGQGKEKGAAVYRAQQMFPKAELHGPRGGLYDGRAEALLIAKYGQLYTTGG